LLGQQPIDLQRVFRLEDCRCDGSFGLVEIAVEITVRQMRRALMQAADEIKRAGSDHDPRPVRYGEVLLDLVMQQQRRDAQGEAEDGDTTERDRHAHHAFAADGLEYE
jgi:hypothetical protein